MKRSFPELSQDNVTAAYAEQGLTYLNPDSIGRLSTADVAHLAAGAVAVMDQVFDRSPANTAKHTAILHAGISDGTRHLFVVVDHKGDVLATTQVSKTGSSYAADSEISSYEAGVTGKLKGQRPGFARDLLLGRFAWAAETLSSKADFLTSNTRVARSGYDPRLAPNGGVLRYFLDNTTAVPGYSGYFNTVGQGTVEPFVHSIAPFNPEGWIRTMGAQRTYVPAGMESIFSRIFRDSLDDTRPSLQAAPSSTRASNAPLYQLGSANELLLTTYVVTTNQVTPSLKALSEPPANNRNNSLGEQVIVEADVTNNQGLAAAVYRELGEEHFVPVGWKPSAYLPGGLAVVMGRRGVAPVGFEVAEPNLTPALARLSLAAHHLTASSLSYQAPDKVK